MPSRALFIFSGEKKTLTLSLEVQKVQILRFCSTKVYETLYRLSALEGFLRQMEHFLNDMTNRLNTKNETNRPLRSARLVSFLFSNSAIG